MNLPNPPIITTAQELRILADELRSQKCIAFDTESNSLFAYKERICLVQISTRQADYLVDPLALPDLEPLRPILADPAIEKVFHAAEYDLICMKRDFHFEVANLFDTMFAARIVGRKQFGLGALLEEFFGVQSNKRFQRADWSLRPLPPDQLQYAQQDTHYLLQLRDQLQHEIEAKGRLREAAEVFDALTRVQAAEHTFDESGYWHINGTREFTRRQMAILRELWLWRDGMARYQDVPTFKIISDQSMVGLVLAAPESINDLRNLRDLSPYQARRYGQDLLSALAQGQVAPLPHPPVNPRRVDPEIQARYDALHTWRKERAVERGVESDIILSKESMWALARNPPVSVAELDRVPGLGPWRRNEYGPFLIDVVAKASVNETQ